MNVLIERVDALIRAGSLPWSRQGKRIRVELDGQDRSQLVRLERHGDRYVLSSVVAGGDLVRRRRRRDLAYRIWRRNASKSVVTFRLDERDHVLGVIEQPVISMHDDELRFYVEVLAKECDRFEYVLTGGDRG